MTPGSILSEWCLQPTRCSCVRLFVPLVLLLSACSNTGVSNAPSEVAPDDDPIIISISLYILDDADGGAESPLSSKRQIAEIEEIADRMNTIWEQAGIVLDVETVARIDIPANVLIDLVAGDTTSFIDAASRGAFVVPRPAAINGFYLGRIGTANGLTPLGTRIFFVADEPTVNDERVSSHEIGHIFGLHHVLDNSGQLMFSGTNGTELDAAEQSVARYSIEGILDGVR
ncbi:hypothetical protein MNBD_ACTINO02-1442 [hydrothermal vent metagenome]|uniref:Peptidase M10 metallopeptidase domain-containing protein n=1 Tax=hydrothermal vent metagenome TaxID=652676 RepID=A0A3B0S7R1_9ZZZZ